MTITLEQLSTGDATILRDLLRNDSQMTPLRKLSLLSEWKNSYPDKLYFINRVAELEGGFRLFFDLIESLHAHIPENNPDELGQANRLVISLINDNGLTWGFSLHKPMFSLLQTVMITSKKGSDERANATQLLNRQWRHWFTISIEKVSEAEAKTAYAGLKTLYTFKTLNLPELCNIASNITLFTAASIRAYIDFIEGFFSILTSPSNVDHLATLIRPVSTIRTDDPFLKRTYLEFVTKLLERLNFDFPDHVLQTLLSPVLKDTPDCLRLLQTLIAKGKTDAIKPHFTEAAKNMEEVIKGVIYPYDSETSLGLMIEMSKQERSLLPILYSALFPNNANKYCMNNLIVFLGKDRVDDVCSLLVDYFIHEKEGEQEKSNSLLQLIFESHPLVQRENVYNDYVPASRYQSTHPGDRVTVFNFMTDCAATPTFKKALIKLIMSGIFRDSAHHEKAKELAKRHKSWVIAELLGETYNSKPCEKIFTPEERETHLKGIASGVSPLRAFSDIPTTGLSWKRNNQTRSSKVLKMKAAALECDWVDLASNERALSPLTTLSVLNPGSSSAVLVRSSFKKNL